MHFPFRNTAFYNRDINSLQSSLYFTIRYLKAKSAMISLSRKTAADDLKWNRNSFLYLPA